MTIFCDAHLHAPYCTDFCNEHNLLSSNGEYRFATSAHSQKEWHLQDKIIDATKPPNPTRTFAVHPQSVGDGSERANLLFLQHLLATHQVDAIGEAGIDLFGEYKATKSAQLAIWEQELDLAIEYRRPLLVHCRRAIDAIFASTSKLRKVPAVIFHAFCGNALQADAILQKSINAYFSLGKQLLNGNKKAASCVKCLPLDRLLLETDAPYCTLKGEKATSPLDIAKVYHVAHALHGQSEFDAFCTAIAQNFAAAFCQPTFATPRKPPQ